MAKPGERFKTEHGVFDAFTNQTLFKLASAGHFEGLKSPISIGKESNVFSAETSDNSLVAVKIYRLETSDFNIMYSYIQSDPRFTGLNKNRRKVIFAWAQREYRNLLIAREHNIAAPMPLVVRNNVLVEEFIGTKTQPAPRLINAAPKNPRTFLTKLIKELKKLYAADMTHGDLSAFNILNYNDNPVLIDFSQATVKKNPRFQELFERDIKAVVQYFNKHGVDTTVEKVINTIERG